MKPLLSSESTISSLMDFSVRMFHGDHGVPQPQRPLVSRQSGQGNKKRIPPVSPLISSLPFSPLSLTGTSAPFSPSQSNAGSKLNLGGRSVRAHALNVGTGSDGYEERHNNIQSSSLGEQHSDASLKSDSTQPPNQFPYPFSVVLVLGGACALALLSVVLSKGPSSLLPALAKSGFTAAFSLIFVSEIGDKTFFIAALLAMQYDKLLVLLGSMAALSLMTILSVVIGLIFHSVPSQFQTTLPIGEYAAVTLLMFFGLKSIKDAWDLPSAAGKTGDKPNQESDEFTEAEELVKEKVSKRLSNPLEVVWKSFSLVFFAEWGDRSMLATIALGAAQSAWGVASGAIVGHLVATSIAILGGAFLANYISEKLVGYIGGCLFLVFAIATFFGVF